MHVGSQKNDRMLEFYVDNELTDDPVELTGQQSLDLDSYLFVGGVTPAMFANLPDEVNSRKGFAGTLLGCS